MARELRRLLIARERLSAVAPLPAGGAADPPRLALTADERHYLERVLRYVPGERFAVVDGVGQRWTARLQAGGAAQLEQPLTAPLQAQPAPQPLLVLVAAVVKRDFEVVVRMAVELGVDRLIPVLSEHSAVQGQLRADRWHSIAVEAAEQCERLWLPRIDPATRLPELLDAERRAVSGALRLWCTTRSDDLPGLVDQLPGTADAPEGGGQTRLSEVWLACGPEGGWSGEEDQRAEQAGWQAVQLGPRILRTSTACVSGLGALSLWRGRLFGC